jgi:protein phosphatase
MKISILELSLVVLIGPSGSGKSSFGRKLFLPTEVVSSDECRGLVSDNENDQAATNDAFDLLHTIVRKRLGRGRLTVIDATNVQPEARKSLVEMAREYHVLPVAIVFDLSEKLCQERNASRPDRQFGPHVIRNQAQQMRRSLRGLEREGFRYVFKLSSPEEVDAVSIERQPLWNNRRDVHGPFDIVGDVHGCFDELLELMSGLGYQVDRQEAAFSVAPPDDRKLVFVGDLVDRGPATPDVLRLVMTMVNAGQAFCVPGNHDMKLVKALKGRDVQLTHGLAESLQQLEQEPAEFRAQVLKFLDDLVSHYVFDDGKLVVAHAGLKESMQGRGSGKVRDFALYGETTGETDEFGLPVRYNWSMDYRGKALVVYGHTPAAEPLWLNGTINIDTGCVFGGKLTALRYPEREIVSVPAKATYYESRKPFLPSEELAPRAPFHLLASEGSVHTDKQHGWHMEMLTRLCAEDEKLLLATPFKIVDLNDTASCDQATEWWVVMTSAGGEGMVVKPLDFISKGRRGYAQPAVKCRGPEYLRIIYGPEYLMPENLERLRSRGLGAKRSLASREFALGMEALDRFVRKEPLRRTHECVFGVLALESEPVDPRL